MYYEGFFLFDNLEYWPLPEHLSLEVTNRCNLRCSHCFQSHFEFPRGDLRPEVWDKIKSLLVQIPSVSLSSAGEPLLASHFREMFLFVKGSAKKVSLTTNAHLLDKFLDLFVGSLDELNVSLDAVDEKLYFARRKAPLQKVVSNLKALEKEKRQKGTPLPRLSFIVVLNRENIGNLPEIVAFASQVGAESVIAYHQIFYTQEAFLARSLFWTPELYDRYLKEALLVAQKAKVTLIHPGTFDGEIPPHPATAGYLSGTPERPFCSWIFKTASVSWNGFVQACCFCDRLLMGRIPEEDFKALWNGPAYRLLRLSFYQGKVPGECRNCQFFQVLSLKEEKAFLCPHREGSFYQEEALLIPAPTLRWEKASVLYQEGLNSFLREDWGAAAKIFEKIRDREPSYFEALNALAVSFYFLGKKERARELIKEACVLFPQEKKLFHNAFLMEKKS